MVTITSLVDAQPTAPAAPYLWTIVSGLRETCGSPGRVADYLVQAPGVGSGWTYNRMVGLALARTAPVTGMPGVEEPRVAIATSPSRRPTRCAG